MDKLDSRLNYAQNSAEDIDRKIISTDNYIEKYLPIKIHKFIVNTLRNVFDNKKDLKKLKDFHAKKEWLLNQAVQNDNGIPGDFKKTIHDDVNEKLDKVKVPKKSKRTKGSKLSKERVDDTQSSIGDSLVSPPNKVKKRRDSNDSQQKSNFSNSVNEDFIYNKGNNNDSISYQNSAQEEEMLQKILDTPSQKTPNVEVKTDTHVQNLSIDQPKGNPGTVYKLIFL